MTSGSSLVRSGQHRRSRLLLPLRADPRSSLPSSVAEKQTNPDGPQLRLRPFPAMRFDPSVVGDIAKVTSPPYDVMDRPMIDDLLNRHPRNIVRLILPWMVSDPVRAEDPYARAAKLMRRWRQKGILHTDDEPALYVYAYRDGDREVCGLVGALELRRRDVDVVLPHEDVIPAIVADRLAMMANARPTSSPSCWCYDGAGASRRGDRPDERRRPARSSTSRRPTARRTRCGRSPSGPSCKAIRRTLAPHQALIADGHHRYATYLQLRKRHRAVGDGKGPWDRGSGPARSTSRTTRCTSARSTAAMRRAQPGRPADAARVRRVGHRRLPPLRSSPEPPAAPERVRRAPTAAGLGDVSGTTGHRDAAVSDAELLHERLLPAWAVTTEDQVGYTHLVDQTVHNAQQDSGVAVLMHPTTVAEVMAVGSRRQDDAPQVHVVRPEARMGLIMRCFDDEVEALP